MNVLTMRQNQQESHPRANFCQMQNSWKCVLYTNNYKRRRHNQGNACLRNLASPESGSGLETVYAYELIRPLALFGVTTNAEVNIALELNKFKKNYVTKNGD